MRWSARWGAEGKRRGERDEDGKIGRDEYSRWARAAAPEAKGAWGRDRRKGWRDSSSSWWGHCSRNWTSRSGRSSRRATAEHKPVMLLTSHQASTESWTDVYLVVGNEKKGEAQKDLGDKNRKKSGQPKCAVG